jgi:hypothetical protein
MILPEDLRVRWETIHKLIYPEIEERMKRIHEKRDNSFLTSHVVEKEDYVLPKGTVVFYRHSDPKLTSKLDPVFVGPFLVNRMTRAKTYVLENEEGEFLERKFPLQFLRVINKPFVEKVLDERAKAGDQAVKEFKVKLENQEEEIWVEYRADLPNLSEEVRKYRYGKKK